MTDLPPAASSDRPADWRERYDAARGQGVPLDPTSEPVRGVNAYPTSYDRSHLLVTVADGALDELLELLRQAASDFGWGIELQNMDGSPLTPEDASARAQRWREALELPTVHRVEIFPQPSPDKEDQPVPPIDAWRLLQRARARVSANGGRPEVPGVSLDHVLTVDPFGSTNPFGARVADGRHRHPHAVVRRALHRSARRGDGSRALGRPHRSVRRRDRSRLRPWHLRRRHRPAARARGGPRRRAGREQCRCPARGRLHDGGPVARPVDGDA